MRSKLSAITAFIPSSATPFAAQSRDDPDPYSLPARINSGRLSCWYFIDSVVDEHLFAIGKMKLSRGLRSRGAS